MGNQSVIDKIVEIKVSPVADGHAVLTIRRRISGVKRYPIHADNVSKCVMGVVNSRRRWYLLVTNGVDTLHAHCLNVW